MRIQHDEVAMRTAKVKIMENAAVLNRIVDSVVGRYSRELDQFVARVKEMIDTTSTLTDAEIEDIVLRVPIYIYFAVEGLETLGVEGDNAKALKAEAFNEAYLEATGTIPDKTKRAELDTFTEQMMEAAYTRAYKKLKLKIEAAEHVFSGAKKILSKRLAELDMRKQELTYGKDLTVTWTPVDASSDKDLPWGED